MIFFALFFLAGIALCVGTIFVNRKYKKIWKAEKGLYFKAGLSLMAIEIFHFTVLDSAFSYWPGFAGLHFISQGLLLGLAGGLFFELGRFFILDKVCKPRSFKDCLYFGMGWNGVMSFMLGALMILGTFGLYTLLNTNDLASLLPNAGASELQQLQEYKDILMAIVYEQPLSGIAPLFERGALLLLDVLLTILVAGGLLRGNSAFVWLAVLAKAGFIAFLFIANHFHYYLGLFLLAGTGVVSLLLIKKARKLLLEYS